MRLIKIACFLALLALLGAMIVNCSSSDDTDADKPTPIQGRPDFIGTITQVNSTGENDVLGTILVEGEDFIKSSDKYVVTVKTETLLFDQNEEAIDLAALEPGQQVRIWFSGAVAESYPAQVAAAQIMIVADAAIGLGDEFQLAIGQRMELADALVEIVFKDIIGDNRCAQDVVCIQQGEVNADIEITDRDGTHSMTLTQPGLFYDFTKDSYAGYEIAFKVLPYPESENPIADAEYRLVLIITRKDTQATGVLKGHVTIGPITPVVQPGDDPEDVPPEVYDARKIMVYDASGANLIEQVAIGYDGNYSVGLAPGSYVVDINNIGIDHSDQVPATVEILPGETVQLDIDIDTGIR